MISWFIRPLIQAFSLYSHIPMPNVKWEDTNDGRVLMFFPLVGSVTGAVMGLWVLVCGHLAIPVTASAFIMIAIPVLITGGIHLDGFVDTCDARHSYKSREEKLMILSDPHVGAFGVIRLVLYILIAIAASVVILQGCDTSFIPMVILAMTFSRTLSGWTSVAWKGAKDDGMLRSIAGNKDGSNNSQKAVKIILFIEIIVVGAAMIILSPVAGSVVVAAEFCMMGLYYLMAMDEFGGVTGDLAGWFLCMAELVGASAMAVYTLVGGLI